jgi:nucleotide-binding universal stress UspA family protein
MMEAHTRPGTKASSRFSKLLVPVDFSSHSRRALDYATHVGKALGAELHLLHAWNPLSWVSAEGALTVPDNTLQMIRESSARSLELWGEVPFQQGVPCKTHLEAGPASPTIAQVAGELGVDLVVIGARGRAGLRDVLLGSVAERTIRQAPCPVVTINERVPIPPALPLKKIVIGVDFSEACRQAVKFARDFGAALGRPQLMLVHAWSVPVEMAHLVDERARKGNGSANGTVTEEFGPWLDYLRNEGWDVEIGISPNPPEDSIVEIAGTEDADLVVVGTQGRSAVAAVPLGSVAERVVRTAGCATVTAR